MTYAVRILLLVACLTPLALFLRTPTETPSQMQTESNTNAETVQSKPLFDREALLDDPLNRISDSFLVPESLRKRVAFWFDIYTSYTKDQHVLHHAKYPWIVFGVVDVTPILNGPEHRWVKYHRAVRHVRTETERIRNLLGKMARKKDLTQFTEEETRLAQLLEEVPGARKQVYSGAATALRTQLGQFEFMQGAVQRIGRYSSMMEKVFEEKGLPTELTRIPLVESSFNHEAVSKVGAGGVWQIMPGIGRRFMTINNQIDERLSPIKSTEVAARLLRENKIILREWPLAVTAYNHGPGGLRKAALRHNTWDLGEIIDKHRGGSFGFASSNFYAEFLAALHAEKYRDKIYGVDAESAIFKEPLTLRRSISLRQLSDATGVPLEEIFHLNKDLAVNKHPRRILPRGFKIFLPQERARELSEAGGPMAQLFKLAQNS